MERPPAQYTLPEPGGIAGGQGSHIAIIFNGSPLFTGDAGSGESNIRRWIVENDMLEAVVGLPDQLFYNASIYQPPRPLADIEADIKGLEQDILKMLEGVV